MAESFSPLAILKKWVDALTEELPQVLGGHVKAIHRTRVATRRLREVLPVAVRDRQTTKDLSRRLRDVNRILGPVRELDVLAQLIAEPEGRYSVAALSTAVRRARREASGRLEISARKLRKLAWRLNDAVADVQSSEAVAVDLRKVRRNWLWAIQARIIQRASRVRSAMDHAGVLYASGPLHDVRVSIKKLRYAIELSDEIGEFQPGAVRTLRRTQDLLGRQHDLEILLLWGRQAQLSEPQTANWRELSSLTRAIERDCRELHARYIRERTALTALISRIGSISDSGTVAVERAVG